MPFKDKARMRNYMKNRYQNDPEFRKKMIGYIMTYQKRNPFKIWANAVRQSHRHRRISIEITTIQLEELAKQTKFCLFCGCPLKYGVQNGKKKWHGDSASADRIDNTKSFNEKNIQIICVRCNTSKSKMAQEEFQEWIKTLYLKFFGKV